MREQDLRIDVFTQPGGDCYTSIRIVHMPTGIVVRSPGFPTRGPDAESTVRHRDTLLDELREKLNEL